MEVEFSNQSGKQNEKLQSPKKQRKEINYEMNELANENNKMRAEKDIQAEILDICLQIFPYPQPYTVQIDCMKNIINSLCNKQNLLFQSPTGTGKTLVTICSALAYTEKFSDVQVLVLTRTNEQINGFIKEIRKINKYPMINRYSILAGRGQFCLFLDEFKNKFEQQGIQKSKFNKHLTQNCNNLCKTNKCETHESYKSPDMDIFKNNSFVNIVPRVFADKKDESGCQCCPHYKIYKKMIKKKQKENITDPIYFPLVSQGYNQPHQLPDIEDMKNLFKQQELGCPFYFNKFATRSAKLVFSTYNYVIKQNILANIKDLFEGELIVIFDEAHNISEQAEQEQSTKLQQKYWEQLDTTLQQVQKVFKTNYSNKQNLNNLYQHIHNLVAKDIQEESNYFMHSLQKKIDEGDSTDTDSSNSDSEEPKNDLNDSLNDDVEKVLPKFKHVKYTKQVPQDDQKQSKRKFNQSIQYSQDYYDKVYSVIFQNADIPENSNEKLKEICLKIKSMKDKRDYTYVEMEKILGDYRDLRIQEIFDYFNNFQNHFLSIKEDCESIQYIFDEKNSKDIKQFCNLFSDQEIIKRFELLNVNDISQAKEFIEKITKLFTNLQYIKKVIKQYTSEEKKESKEQKKDPQSHIFVAENNQVYEANLEDVNNSLKKFGEGLKLKYIQKIWFFYYRLIKMRKLYNYQEDPHYLSNHYISLLRNDYSPIPVLQIGCLSASYLFKKIQKKINISSLILTSGTLEPFELIQKSIDMPFQNYSSPHIINSQTNLFTEFITEFDGQQIGFSMSKLQDQEQRDLIFSHSQQIINLIIKRFNTYTQQTKKKGGVVIFFKSYQMLQQYVNMIKMVQSNDFRYFVENRDSNEFKESYNEYKRLISQNRSNCIFLAVNRGKLSEGIDLKDDLCRVVILFGIPYPNLTDPYVVCKRTHASKYLKENQWYKKETVKVVNQSAGRCIRYKDDWGCIFFLDSQYYSESNIYNHISKWIREGQKMKNKQKNEWVTSYNQFLEQKAQEHLLQNND